MSGEYIIVFNTLHSNPDGSVDLIGIGRSVDVYDTAKEAMKHLPEFTFEDNIYTQIALVMNLNNNFRY